MDQARRVVAGLAVVGLYVGLAWLSAEFAVLESLTVWYAPAGLALGLGVVIGWRALPALALGEVLVGLLLFGVGDDFGWLVVPNGVLYATVYVGFGRLVTTSDAIGDGPRERRPLQLLSLAVGAALAASAVGVGFQVLAGVTPLSNLVPALAVWWLGDVVGVAGIGVTVVAVAIRAHRRARWWALPEARLAESVALVVLPSLLTVLVALGTDGVAPYATAVFLPSMLLAVRSGVPGVALSVPLTSLTMTAVADAAFGADTLARTDLQFVLLLLLVTSFGAAFAAERQRELRMRLATREQHLTEAQQQARSGSFRWDVIGDTVEWSEGLFALFGTDRGPVTASDYLDRVHPEDRERVAAAIQQSLATGESRAHGYRVVRDDGEVLTVRAQLRARLVDGRVVELVGTCTDVTAEQETARRLEEVIAAEREAHATEAEARAAIARTERVKDALLVAVSHEVRTPLTIVRGLVETLGREEFADDRVGEHGDLLQRLQRNIDRLDRVLRDLLDVDRIGRGVVHPVRRPCDLLDLTEQVLASVDTGDNRVRVEMPETSVELDARLTARILEHLVANAVRHAGGGEIRVVGRLTDGAVELRVDDSGRGVDPADRDRLFAAFEHGDVPKHSPGAGVGLFVVARFAELHGGRAWVADSEDGRGASFRVRLPLSSSDGRPQPAAAGPAGTNDEPGRDPQ